MMVLLFWLSTACLLVWQCDVFRKVSQFTWRFSSLTGSVQTVPTGERHESGGYNHDRKIASRGFGAYVPLSRSGHAPLSHTAISAVGRPYIASQKEGVISAPAELKFSFISEMSLRYLTCSADCAASPLLPFGTTAWTSGSFLW